MTRALALGCLLLPPTACGSTQPAESAPPAAEVEIEAPAADAGTTSAELPKSEPRADPRKTKFQFPLDEFLRAVDAGTETWEDFVLTIHGQRSSADLEDTLAFELSSMAKATSTSKGNTASSTQLKLTTAAPFHALLYACAEDPELAAKGKGPCRPAPPGATHERWEQFRFTVTIRHAERGSFEESEAVAKTFLPLIEAMFVGKPVDEP